MTLFQNYILLRTEGVLVTRLLNTTSDEEVNDDDELGDPQEEDSTSIPNVPDPYDGVYSNILTSLKRSIS